MVVRVRQCVDGKYSNHVVIIGSWRVQIAREGEAMGMGLRKDSNQIRKLKVHETIPFWQAVQELRGNRIDKG